MSGLSFFSKGNGSQPLRDNILHFIGDEQQFDKVRTQVWHLCCSLFVSNSLKEEAEKGMLVMRLSCSAVLDEIWLFVLWNCCGCFMWRFCALFYFFGAMQFLFPASDHPAAESHEHKDKLISISKVQWVIYRQCHGHMLYFHLMCYEKRHTGIRSHRRTCYVATNHQAKALYSQVSLIC